MIRPIRAVLLLVPLLLLAGSCTPAVKPVDPVDRELENLRAFAKLYGYIRWFHPSDEAQTIDWNRFAVLGAERVRVARNPEELKAELESLFHPIAPSLVIHRTGEHPDPAAECANDPDVWVAWQHYGVHLGPDSNMYRSQRLGRSAPTASAAFGTWTRIIDARPYRGKRVRLRAAGRVEASGTGNQLQFWMRVDGPDGYRFFDNMSDRPVTNPDWSEYVIEGEVAPDAGRIVFGGFLIGEGQAWIDAFNVVAIAEDGIETPVTVRNAGFEDGDGDGWSNGGDGYKFSVLEGDAFEGRYAAHISNAPDSGTLAEPMFELVPSEGEIVRRDIADGLAIAMPVSLPSDDQRTCPASDRGALDELQVALGGIDPADATSADIRYASVIVAWNVFQHFYPYFDVVDVDWDAELSAALRRARSGTGQESLFGTITSIAVSAKDGHAYVYPAPASRRARLPFMVEWIEDSVVVTASDSPEIVVGDVVHSVDGMDAHDAFAAAKGVVSGTDAWKRYKAHLHFGVGPAESVARLMLERGGRSLTVQVPRTTGYVLVPPTLERIDEIEPGIWYVDLARATSGDIERALTDLERAEGLIVDMRGYPKDFRGSLLGHLVDAPLKTPLLNVPHTVYPDRERVEFKSVQWEVPVKSPRLHARTVFLTGNGAVSAAETVMGIIEGYALGPIVGRPTAGTNGDINFAPLPGGLTVAFTGMKVLKHDGSQYHLIGVHPTHPVKRTIKAIREGRDEDIEKALEIIKAAR